MTRARAVRFGAELFALLFEPGAHPSGYEVVEHGIPDGAELTAARIEVDAAGRRTLVVRVEHASFDEVPEGELIPDVAVEVRRIEPLAAELERLEPRPGDLVVVKVAEPITTDLVSAIRAAMEARLGGACAIVVPPGVDLEALDEVRMRALGWVRRSRQEVTGA